MSSPEPRQLSSGHEINLPHPPGPLDLFIDPIGGSIISPYYGYTVARNSAFADYQDQRLRDDYTGVYIAREQLTHIAGQTFEDESRFDPNKRHMVMEQKFRLGFNTFMLAVITADPTFVEEYGARVPRNTDSLRALQRALRYQENEDPNFYEIPLQSVERIYEQSERELRPANVRGPRLIPPNYRQDNITLSLPNTLAPRGRAAVDIGKETKLPGLKNICQRFIMVAIADTGGPINKSHAVQGGSDAYEGMILGGTAAKNVVLEMALEELSKIRQDYPKAA